MIDSVKDFIDSDKKNRFEGKHVTFESFMKSDKDKIESRLKTLRFITQLNSESVYGHFPTLAIYKAEYNQICSLIDKLLAQEEKTISNCQMNSLILAKALKAKRIESLLDFIKYAFYVRDNEGLDSLNSKQEFTPDGVNARNYFAAQSIRHCGKDLLESISQKNFEEVVSEAMSSFIQNETSFDSKIETEIKDLLKSALDNKKKLEEFKTENQLQYKH